MTSLRATWWKSFRYEFTHLLTYLSLPSISRYNQQKRRWRSSGQWSDSTKVIGSCINWFITSPIESRIASGGWPPYRWSCPFPSSYPSLLSSFIPLVGQCSASAGAQWSGWSGQRCPFGRPLQRVDTQSASGFSWPRRWALSSSWSACRCNQRISSVPSIIVRIGG